MELSTFKLFSASSLPLRMFLRQTLVVTAERDGMVEKDSALGLHALVPLRSSTRPFESCCVVASALQQHELQRSTLTMLEDIAEEDRMLVELAQACPPGFRTAGRAAGPVRMALRIAHAVKALPTMAAHLSPALKSCCEFSDPHVRQLRKQTTAPDWVQSLV